MAFEVNDLRGFLFLVLLALPMAAARNIDCHGRGFHCVNSTHFMICVDLGFGISTTIDDFIIPCPPTTVCHKHNIFECEFPKFEITTPPPLEVIGVSKQSEISETTVVRTSETTTPLIEVSSVTYKPISILSTSEEITPVPEIDVFKSFKEYAEAFIETSTKAEVTIQTTPSALISETVKLDDFVTKYDKSVIVSSVSNADTNNFEPAIETSLDKAVTVSVSDISVFIDTTTPATDQLLDSTLNTFAPELNASPVAHNSYRKHNSIINQTNDNNTLNQNDTGLPLFDEFTTTEKMQVYNSDTFTKSTTSVENTQMSTETSYIFSEVNVAKTTEMTPRHENIDTDSIKTEKSNIASPINSLPTEDKLAAPDPMLINTTDSINNNIIHKEEPSTTTTTTTTSVNLGVGSANEPNYKVEISQTVSKITTNNTYNETSSTTVSLNISDALENNLFENNDLTKPIPKNIVPKSISVKNNEDQTQLDTFQNDSHITEEVHNDLKYNVSNNVPIENQGNVNRRALDVAKDNSSILTEHVQDKINTLLKDLNNIEGIPKDHVMSNETVVIQTSVPFNSATDGLNSIQVQNAIIKTNVEPMQSKPVLLVSTIHAEISSADIPQTPINNITTIGTLVENITDTNVEITNNIISVTDFISVNKTTMKSDLTKTNTNTNQNETAMQQKAFAVPNQVANIDKELKIEQLTTIPSVLEKVGAFTYNSSIIDNITEVAASNKTAQDEHNKNDNLPVDSNIIAILEPTVKPDNVENTTPTSILKPTNPSEDFQLNGTMRQSKLNDTVSLNITDNTILTNYNSATTQNVAIVNNTATDTPQVQILQNITNTTPQINSRKALISNVTTNVNLTPTTTSILPNEVLTSNNVNTLNEITLVPLTTTVIEIKTVPIETTTNFPVLLDTAASLVTQSSLGSVATAPFINVLHKTKPAANNETNYLNLSTEPSVDFSTPKTVIVEELKQVTEPPLHLEDVTTATMEQTVPTIATTEYITTKLYIKNVDNLAQIQGVEMPTENLVESTTSVTSSSPISTAQIQHGEVTLTTETSQTKNTVPQNLQSATHIVDVARITNFEINQTSSFILQDSIKSTTTQDLSTSTTTIKTTTVDEITIIKKPILRVCKELLPVTPFVEKKSLPSVTIPTTPIPKENDTMNLKDNKVDNLTIEDSKTTMNLESNHTSISKQEVVAPLRDLIENNSSQTIKITPITERNQPLPLTTEVTESSTFVHDKSPRTLKILEIKTVPETVKTLTFLTPTVKLSDASFHYILPNKIRTEQSLNRSSPNIYNNVPLNEVTTQQVLNSVTPPDSMVETIQVTGGQANEPSHLGLVVNDTVIKYLTVDTNHGDFSAKHIDREYIENVTSIKSVENEATLRSTKLNDIDEKIQTETTVTPNDGNIINKTIVIFSNKEDESKYPIVTSETQNKELPTISPVDVKPHEDPLINPNTVQYENTPITTNKPYTVSQYLLRTNTVQKDSSEIVSSANNNHVNLEIKNVNFVQTSSSNEPQDLETPNKSKTSTTLNNQEVNLVKHNNTQINGTGNELKLNNISTSVFEPTDTNKQLKASNKDKIDTTATATPFNCSNRIRGKYADEKDCRKFYTCVGNLQPLVGICPTNTVFSDINKQCTRNLSHCVRNNQFRCLREGRFNDFLKDNIYYICIKNSKNKFIRYKFKCNSDYHLNRVSVKCEKNAKNSSQSVSSVSENSRVNDESLSAKTFNTLFECEDEGSFSHSNDCSKYYECTKVKDVYRRKLKKCASDEVFDKERKQCVKSDSTEC